MNLNDGFWNPTIPPIPGGGAPLKPVSQPWIGLGGGQPPKSQQSGVSSPPPFDYAAMREANNQAQRYTDQGLSALTNMSADSPFGQMLFQLFQQGAGLDPALLARLKTQAAEMNAGSMQNALSRSRERSAATGFGNSPGANFAEDQIRGMGAADLQRAYNDLDLESARMGIGRQQGLGALLAQLFGSDAGMRQSYANIQSQRQVPIIPASAGGLAGTPPKPVRTDSGAGVPYRQVFQGGIFG